MSVPLQPPSRAPASNNIPPPPVAKAVKNLYVKSFTLDNNGFYVPTVYSLSNKFTPSSDPDLTRESVRQIQADGKYTQPILDYVSSPGAYQAHIFVDAPNCSTDFDFIIRQYDGVGYYLPMIDRGGDIRQSPHFEDMIRQSVYKFSMPQSFKEQVDVPVDYLVPVMPAIKGLNTLSAYKSEKLLAERKITALTAVVINILRHNRAVNKSAREIAEKDTQSAVNFLLTANETQIAKASADSSEWSKNLSESYSTTDMLTAAMVAGIIACVITAIVCKSK
jgi:hypothetical protein